MKIKTDRIKQTSRLYWKTAPVGKVIAAGVCVLLAALCAAVSASAQTDATIESTRTALEKWVETRRIISQEKRDFALSREMLNERIGLVQREIASLKDKIAEAEASIAQADERRGEMIAENERYKAETESLGAVLNALETRTKEMNVRLPEPLRQRIKPLSQRLPEDPEQTKLSIAERFQNVVGILNEVNKFNRDITVTSEVRAVPDGSSMEVTVLYAGLGQAFYVGANDTIAGIGTATEQGWQWQPKNEAAGQIADAIAILKNEEVASFILLPVTLDR